MEREIRVEEFVGVIGEDVISLNILVDENGNNWFKGKQVAEIIGYSNTREPLSKYVEEENKRSLITFQTTQIATFEKLANSLGLLSNNSKNTVFINETGFYELVLSANTEKAKLFKKWVTGTVLPTLRKNGTYTLGQENLPSELEQKLVSMQKQMLTMFENMTAQQQINELQKELLETKDVILVLEYGWNHGVKFIDAFCTINDEGVKCIGTQEAAALVTNHLKSLGFAIDNNRLLWALRDMGYIEQRRSSPGYIVLTNADSEDLLINAKKFKSAPAKPHFTEKGINKLMSKIIMYDLRNEESEERIDEIAKCLDSFIIRLVVEKKFNNNIASLSSIISK